MTGAQTLSVVYGLVGSLKVVMEGMECARTSSHFFRPFVCLDGKASTDGIRQDLGMCLMRNRYHPS